MARTSSNGTKRRSNTSKTTKAKSAAKKPAQKGRNSVSSQASGRRDSVIDDNARRDILGIGLIVLAIVLFVAAAMPIDAVVTAAISKALHLCLGVGAYLLPIFLAVYGICILTMERQARISLRFAIGLTLILVAVLTLSSSFVPGAANGNPQVVFAENALVNAGGYIGAGIAFVGLSLLGQPITIVLMVGVIIVGLAIIGLSISKLFDTIRERRAAQDDDEDSGANQWEHLPFARVRRGSDDNPGAQAGAAGGFVAARPGQNVGPDGAVHTMVLGQEGAGPTRKLSSTAGPGKPQGRKSAAETMILGENQSMTRKLGKNADSKSAAPKKKRSARPQVPLAMPNPMEGFELPDFDLLNLSDGSPAGGASEMELQETGELLQETLGDFGIMAQVVGWVAGPTVTLFKVDLPSGVRVSRVTALNDDIALALAAPGVRIFAPIPGTNYVGIEVPNKARQTVLLGDVLKDAPAGPLQIAIGKDVEGHCIVSDLAKMPHLLIGGTTGSGKSVSINAMIMSILMRATPSEVRFIMIDPKRVEFTPYNGIPHLYVPVVTEPKEAASALSWGVAEMERRLKVFSKFGARNIGQYNAKVQNAPEDDEELQNAEELPYIVIIIDELADLMMNVGKEVEFSISRIAQLARAAGIHLIVATQRPSANVVTGLIKANITNRIAFNVASSIDSRVVLDTPGAENLIGLGDLLLSKPELAKPQRIQGCYVSEDEIFTVVEHLKSQGEPDYHGEILKTNLITLGDSKPDGSGGSGGSDDPLVWEAADIVVSSGLGSTSNIQRRLSVGYARAGRIMDMLEEKGVVGPPNGSKPREVLVDAMELETLKAFEASDEE